jgi:sec-independent protein translocase protein TatB
MFNIGFSELLILAIIGIIVIGPEQLPSMARKLAKILNDLKRTRDEIMSPVDEFKNEAMRAVDKVRHEAEKVRQQVNQDLNNQVNQVINQVKTQQSSMADSKPAETLPTGHAEKKDEGSGS